MSQKRTIFGLLSFLVLSTAGQGQIINPGFGVNLGYRSPYDNCGFTGIIQAFSAIDLYGNIANKGWATGIKVSFTNKLFKPVLGLSYCYRNKEKTEFGTENNHTYYQSDPIKYIVPEIGCKRRLYSDDKSGHFFEAVVCLNYRVSSKKNNVYYLSGNPIKQKFVDQMNFEIADGPGINIGLIYYFLKHS